MTQPEFPTGAVRPSDAERDQALGVLRDGAGSGRLSHDTFLGRMDIVLQATSRGELDAAVAGLPTGGPVERFVLRAVGRVSAFGDRLNRAWRSERLPGLSLPQAGAGLLTIGRIPGSGLRLHDASVSLSTPLPGHPVRLSAGTAGAGAAGAARPGTPRSGC